MPKVSSLPRLSRNIFVYAQFLKDWIGARAFRRALAKAANDVDVVHFNHEALFLLARWLKPRTDAALSMHIRTNLYGTPFCRWQERMIAKTLDHLVFITENERHSLKRLSGLNPDGTVIHNIVEATAAEPHPAVLNDGRFKIACLSNFAWVRGVDRTAEIATVLRDKNRRDVLFVMAGNMEISRSLPGELGRVAQSGGNFQDYVGKMGLSDMFLFLGHVTDPERVLAACDALIKPTREANPWGRDILEGLGAGKPVISIGSYSEFVEDGVTGILQENFEASEMAQRICTLADDPDLAKRLGAAGRARVQNLCDGPARAKDLQTVWERLVRE
jgi:glycosyltransferase involved in cell wall biosynthesis